MTLLALGLAILLGHMPAYAVDCATAGADDFDADGFTDQLECEGITLMSGDIVAGASEAVPRENRLDPNRRTCL